MKYILKHLRRTKNMSLVFENGELRVWGYIDSDFMSDINDWKSTSDSIFLCNGGAMSWKNFKQTVIADFTIEAEYIAASKAMKKALWFKKFVADLDVMPSDAILLYYDNNDAIALSKELRSHKKFKHIERWFHLICDYLEKGYVEVKRVDSTDNMADALMKQLSQQKIETHLEKMGLKFMVNWL